MTISPPNPDTISPPNPDTIPPPNPAGPTEPLEPVVEPVEPAPQPADPPAPVVDGPPVLGVDGAATTRPAPGFLPTGPARLGVESVFVRFIATAGVVGVGTALGAVLSANDVAGWIVGLVVSTVSVVLAAILWRSRRL